MDWDDVRYFLALARTGSVRAAGGDLGVSHSTVSRRVDALESQLGVRLFDRHRDGFELTDAGHQMLPRAERVEREMASLERNLLGQDTKLEGPIRLTCCDQFVSAMLVRDLAPLCGECPDIELELTIDSRPFDLSKREADIAVRTLPKDVAPPEHLMGRRLVPVVVASYVATEHASRLDPTRPDCRWLGFEDRRSTDALVATSSYPQVPAWGAFCSITTLAQAAREGLGISTLPTYAADPDPQLRRLPEPDIRHLADLWLLGHPDLRDNARLRAAREAITRALRSRDALFRGDAPGWRENVPMRPGGAPHRPRPSLVERESGRDDVRREEHR